MSMGLQGTYKITSRSMTELDCVDVSGRSYYIGDYMTCG